jgi:rubrerythrin
VADNETRENLHTAYEGEAKAVVRLRIYAKKAEEDEHPGVAKLFRAVSSSEAIHARNNFELIDDAVKDTETNLSDSFARETKVAGVSYSGFIATAESEENAKAARMFTWARDVEEVHAKLYEKALEHMLADEEPNYYICDVCGYVSDGKIPDVCPVCGSDSRVFFEAE